MGKIHKGGGLPLSFEGPLIINAVIITHIRKKQK